MVVEDFKHHCWRNIENWRKLLKQQADAVQVERRSRSGRTEVSKVHRAAKLTRNAGNDLFKRFPAEVPGSHCSAANAASSAPAGIGLRGAKLEEPSHTLTPGRAPSSALLLSSAELGPEWLKSLHETTKQGAPRSNLHGEHGIGDLT